MPDNTERGFSPIRTSQRPQPEAADEKAAEGPMPTR